MAVGAERVLASMRAYEEVGGLTTRLMIPGWETDRPLGLHQP